MKTAKEPSMNILMFGWEFPPNISGGLGTACYGMTKGLSEIDGVNVTLVLPRLHKNEDHSFATLVGLPDLKHDFKHDLKQDIRLANDRGIQHGILSASVTALLKAYGGGDLIAATVNYAERAARLFADHDQFDVIHSHDWLTSLAGKFAKKISGKPSVLHIHSTEYDRAGANADARIIDIERCGMDAADQIIAVSNFTRDIVIERYRQNPEKVITIYNGIERGHAASAVKSINRKSSKTVTFLGRITQQKGPAYFIQAASKALQHEPELRFVMAGDGDLLPEMKALAKSLGLTGRIVFPGFLQADEVQHLLERTDIYVMPSVSEPFGISALEAINANIPSILSRQSGVVELFEHVVKVDHWDIDTIASYIVEIARDPGYADNLRTKAKTELADLPWTVCAENLKANYGRLIAA
ncbi:glycosyltransferase family 4 protein [Undibacterium sp. TJN19]|uniref:glycosyltransferase family 4 protein n=1 Tax=Undibacterium sp. TJN19 TaxID=3413055 RepID=UPI003BF185EF